jgi:H/ACA ribonucleoprotein complex subunit 4
MPNEKVRWLVKSEDETDESYGKPPQDRSMEEAINNSIIIIDKQAGPTSHQVTKWVCDIFKDYAKVAGHSGTLDPAVTGVLPVVLGNATKAMTALNLGKEYVGVMHIHKPLPRDAVESVTRQFVGKIKQLPPVKSAIARKLREREVYFFDILEMEGQDILFKVGCEAGTYIRKLCHDIGQKLGVGAHMAELRRTKVGDFTEEQSHSLVEVKDAYEFWRSGDEKKLRKILMPVEHALLHLKAVLLKDSAVDAVCNGSPAYASGLARIQDGTAAGELVAIYTLKGEIVALGIARMESKEMLKAKRGVAVRTDRVFMDRGIYPRWK